ncbi:MAG TPA: LysM peptidoglycan-binding domain-containing protein [Microbacteriaceae bacterium]|nr:LysM peptidoglycan-binding domain-containing protein [Microbacteriaceae bacterium]
MTAALITPGFARQIAAAPVAPTRLRLTRRGRFVLGSLAVAAVLTSSLAFGVNATPAQAGDSAGATLSYITVEAGESLWSVAESIAPNRDPRDVIQDIVSLNGLDSVNVPAGSRIALPNY